MRINEARGIVNKTSFIVYPQFLESIETLETEAEKHSVLGAVINFAFGWNIIRNNVPKENKVYQDIIQKIQADYSTACDLLRKYEARKGGQIENSK